MQITVMAKTLEDENGVVIVNSRGLCSRSCSVIRYDGAELYSVYDLLMSMNKQDFLKSLKESSAVRKFIWEIFTTCSMSILPIGSPISWPRNFLRLPKHENSTKQCSWLLSILKATLYTIGIKSEIEKFQVTWRCRLFMKRTKSSVQCNRFLMTHGFAAYHQHQAEHTSLQNPITGIC